MTVKSAGAVTFSFMVLCAEVAWAQVSNADWKLYGGMSIEGGSEYCFYDNKDVQTGPDGHIRVWTECLPKRDVEAIDIEKEFDDKILEETAEKLARDYVPPISKAESIDTNQSMMVVVYETIANTRNIQPNARIFYELDCLHSRSSELSIYVQVNGQNLSRDKPSKWRYPEGDGSSLLKILCPTQ